MSIAHFNFYSESGQLITSIEVALFNTNVSRAWQYSVMLNSNHRNAFARTTSYYNDVANADRIASNTVDLNRCLDALKGTQFEFTELANVEFGQIDQPLLNRLHRHFTNSCRDLWDFDFRDHELQAQLNPVLQNLNNAIHILELYTPTDTKVAWHKIGQELFVCADGAEIGYDIFPHRSEHSFEAADLILDPYILGKTLIESFMCDDNPVNWDTAGHVRTNGGACFILTDHRQRIYQSLEFSRWLFKNKVSLSQVFADIPLGNFVAGHKEKLSAFMQSPEFKKCYCQVRIEIN